MQETQTNITQTIISTINTIFSSLFSSIDNGIYSILDDLVFINTDILKDKYFISFFGTSTTSGLIILSNSLLLALSLFYIVRYAYSHYSGSQTEQPFQFLFKLFIFAIISNFSYFIMEQFITINSLISLSIRELGENIFECNISFSELILKMNTIVSTEDTINIFSLNGFLRGFISFSFINLLFSYSLRYIILKVFILITPFAIISLITNSTSWFFKSWFKCVLSLLLLQSFISLILLIIFSIDFSSDDLISKILCVGSIYSLTKANSYIKDLIGGISTDVSSNFSTFKYLLKK